MKLKHLFLPVVLVSLAIYLVSMPHHPSLDPDLPFLNSAAGRGDLPPGAHPLWSTIIRLADGVTPSAHLARAVRLMSILAAAMFAGVVAHFTSRLPRDRTLAEAHSIGGAAEHGLSGAWVRYLSGWVAGCLVAFSPAFFGMAFTVGPSALHLLLIVAIGTLMMRARTSRQPVPLLTAASFLAGITAAEYAALIPWMPVLALLGLASLMRRGRLALKSAVLPAVAGMAGLVVGYGIIALFWLSPIHQGLIPGRTLGSVVIDAWRTQGVALMALVNNPVGLTITAACSLVPPLYLILFAKNQEAGPATRAFGGVLSLVMAALGIAVYFETPVSPNTVYAGWTRLVVPYVLVCVMLGYLAGLILAVVWTLFPRAHKTLRWALRFPVLALLLAIPPAVGAIGWTNLRPFRSTHASRVAAKAAGRVGPDDLVLLHGDPLDPLLVYYLGGRRRGTILVDLSRAGLPDRQRVYRNILPEFREFPGRIEPEAIAAAACRRSPQRVVTWAASLLAQTGTSWTWEGLLFRNVPGRLPSENGHAPLDDAHAWSALAQGSMTGSRRSFDLWYNTALQCSRVLNDAGVALERAGDLEGALSLYDRAAEASPDNVSARMNLAHRAAGQSAYGRGIELVESARAVLRQGLARPDPAWIRANHGLIHAPEAYAQLGIFLAAHGKADPAIAELEQALAMNPEAPRLRMLLARLRIRQGEYEEAENMLRQLLAEDPESGDAREALGILKAQQGDMEAATRLLDESAGDAGGSPEVQATIALLRAQAGDFAAAEAALARLSQTGSAAASPMLALTRAYMAARQGAGHTARNLLGETRAAVGERPDLLLLAAEIHKLLGEEEEMERAVRSALDLDPENPSGLSRMILLLMARGDIEQALPYARRRLAGEPDDWMALIVVGTWEIREGRFAAAIEPLRRSVDSRATALALNNLAWALDQTGQVEEALDCARRALPMAPDYADLLDTLGWLLYRTGTREEGLAHLQRALQIEPKSPSSHLHLGLIAEIEGRMPAARDHLEIAAAGGISRDGIAAARKQLAGTIRH